MAIASGIGSQLGIATETTPGTYVPPTSFFRMLSESLELKKDFTKIPGLGADAVVQQDGLHVETTRHVEGDIVPVPCTVGMGKLLNLLTHLTTITPTGSGTAKTFVFPVGLQPPDGKSASLQIGIPGTDGVVQAAATKGTVVTAITFAMATSGVLTCTATLWAADFDTTTTLATAVYPSGAEAFSFLGSVLQFDDAAVGACVKSWTFTVTFPKASDRFCLNGSGTALVPITNGQITIAGAYELEFGGGWTQYNAFKNATRRKLTLKNSGRTDIEAGKKAQLNFTFPKIVIEDNGTPQISGPDLITTSPSWTAVADGTNAPLSIEYVTTDTAI